MAEVNWYTGGRYTVTLPTLNKIPMPGVYLAKAKHIQWHYPPWMARFPSITQLRWIGTRRQFVQVICEMGMIFGETKLGLINEMLNQDEPSECTDSGEDERAP